MQDLTVAMSSWVASGGARLTPHPEGGFAFDDGTRDGPHMLRLAEPALEGAMVRVSLRARPLPGCSTHLMVMQPMVGPVCRISPQGIVLPRDPASAITVRPGDDGWLDIAVSYFSSQPAAALGTANPAPFYPGTGRPQWVLETVALAVAPPEAADDRRIVALDVGGSLRLAPGWRGLMPQLLPVVIPPPDGPSAGIEEDVARYPGGQVLRAVLYNKKGRRKLNRAADPARSSLLAADRRSLRKFADPAAFEVQEQVSVDCVRYEDLHNAGGAPAPDLIRLSAQGAEYEVLQGFGNLLAPCLAVQVQTAFYPVYKGQKLLGDLIGLLDRFDFGLVAVAPRREGEQIVELQASFLKTADWAAEQAPPVQARLAELRRIGGVAA